MKYLARLLALSALAMTSTSSGAQQQKTTSVVLVHGAFVDGSGWQAVYDILKKDGYEVLVVQNPTITLEGEDMRRDPVEEPAVVANNHRTSSKIAQSFLQRAQRVDIQINCWFVKQKQIGTTFQHAGQMNPVPFTTRQLADRLLLVTTLEIELANIGA